MRAAIDEKHKPTNIGQIALERQLGQIHKRLTSKELLSFILNLLQPASVREGVWSN